jgi:Xaa-Pro aminopeptidase
MTAAISTATAPLPSTVEDFQKEPAAAPLANLQRLHDTLERRGLDGIVAYYSPNVFYLSGYASRRLQVHEANGYGAVIVSRHQPDTPILVVPEFEVQFFLHHPTWIQEVRPYRSLMVPLDLPWDRSAIERFLPETARDVPWVGRARERYVGNMNTAILEAMKDVGLDRGRLGCDNPWLAVTLREAMEPNLEVADAYGLMKFVRSAKTPAEVWRMRAATAANQRIQEQLVAEFQLGMTWRELELAYINKAYRLGGFVVDRTTLHWANTPGQDPHLSMAAPWDADFEVEPGMAIMFDSHGCWNNYNWDGGKTWYVGTEPTGTGRLAAKACGDAIQDLIEGMRPGRKMSELHALGRRAIDRNGLPRVDAALVYFHGLGIENSDREAGNSADFDWQLEEGMVVAAHVVYPGDDRNRAYMEEIGVVTDHGLDRFFTWDFGPLTG